MSALIMSSLRSRSILFFTAFFPISVLAADVPKKSLFTPPQFLTSAFHTAESYIRFYVEKGWAQLTGESIPVQVADTIMSFIIVFVLIYFAQLLIPEYWRASKRNAKNIHKYIGYFVVPALVSVTFYIGVVAYYRNAHGMIDSAASASALELIGRILLMPVWLAALLVVPITAIVASVALLVIIYFLPGWTIAPVLRFMWLFLVVLFKTPRYLHYLFVAHPVEKVMKEDIENNVPDVVMAKHVADVMGALRIESLENLPKDWISENRKKRIDALSETIESENAFMEQVAKFIKMKNQTS